MILDKYFKISENQIKYYYFVWDKITYFLLK